MHRNRIVFTFLLVFIFSSMKGQTQTELNQGWQCINVSKVNTNGIKISDPSFDLSEWLPATVPGTVLTTLLNNKLVPDPFYGMKNKEIPDIYFAGSEYYTYWFVNDFKEHVSANGEQFLLHLRGINYGCDVFLNGHRLNQQTHYGMFLRQTYNITDYISKDGNNRLAVIVFPPKIVGNPNGGQGGDGTIAHNVSIQYSAGWDWIQSIADRNTGIWDKVTIEKTNQIDLKNSHIITLVPGKRFPGEPQAPAIIKVSSEIENLTSEVIQGTLQYSLKGNVVQKPVRIEPNSTVELHLPDYTLTQPLLWWPNSYGDQYLYDLNLQFINGDKKILDQEDIKIGIREIQTQWNEHTQSRQIFVNGQKIFIKGGNWIISDAMLRFSPERYDAEIRFHRDMNLNLIRIWGGALAERPEFYEACDRYGLLVMQDFWMSGDCNGKWLDPMKKEDQWTRRNYPDDHQLFMRSVDDQVKMIRNHPSLAIWCGGNEITPPEDILKVMQDSILPTLDGTRYFFTFSNSDSMSYNSIGGNGDGPYTIQNDNYFWENRSFPFNSEIGSVGTGDYESLERFIPEKNMVVPDYINHKVDSVWEYHKDIGYEGSIDRYGKAKDVADFATKAQLVNYNQYRALIEGFSAHMWDWYTGLIIWKTQNPWTSLRGQMYDYYLDPNACLYGLRNASEPLHVMCNPVDGMTMIVNNSFKSYHNLMMEVKAYTIQGECIPINNLLVDVSPASVQKYFPIKKTLDKIRKNEGMFLSLRLIDAQQKVFSENLYWLPDSTDSYSGLQRMPQSKIKVEAKKMEEGRIQVNISNSENGALAFFNRLSLVDAKSRKRILPVFYSNNYISLRPGENKTIFLDYTPSVDGVNPIVSIKGWNVAEQFIEIK